nr:OB-fold nucleic acid binding domain-containing protein [Candidatus Sigynarchaeota archaeon]
MSQSYRVDPAPPMRIIDVVQGIYDATNKELLTIFGTVKSATIVGTVIDMKLHPAQSQDKKSRLAITIDDGTATIQGSYFGVDDDIMREFETGDIVIMTGRINEYNNEIKINPKHVVKIKNLNEELLHRARTLDKLMALKKKGEPLVLKDGGRVTNRPDEASKLFNVQAPAGTKIEDIETPIPINGSLSDDGDENGVNQTFADFAGDDGVAFEEDDEIIKTGIMETLGQGDAMGVEELAKALGYKDTTIQRVIHVMLAERGIRQVQSNPNKYGL